MTYQTLVEKLTATKIPFREGAWVNAGGMRKDYGVYAIDGRNDLAADGTHAEKMLEGTVDLFAWNNNGLAKAGLIEAAMEEAGVAWRVNLAANYEENTGYTHWEWIFNCLG